MKRRVRLASGLAAVLCLGMTGSASAGTLDQHQDNADSFPALFGGMSPQSEAQTFSPGIPGKLDQVDLMFEKLGTPPDPNITIQIRSTSGDAPGPLSAVLATGSVPVSSVGSSGAFFSIPITPAVPVSIGTHYAIVAYNAGEIGNAVSIGEEVANNTYGSGTGFGDFASYPPDGDWVDAGVGSDLAFRTYVEQTPPTPTPTRRRKCKKKHKRSAESAKKKRCKKHKKK
jgi:hypothetical protein